MMVHRHQQVAGKHGNDENEGGNTTANP